MIKSAKSHLAKTAVVMLGTLTLFTCASAAQANESVVCINDYKPGKLTCTQERVTRRYQQIKLMCSEAQGVEYGGWLCAAIRSTPTGFTFRVGPDTPMESACSEFFDGIGDGSCTNPANWQKK